MPEPRGAEQEREATLKRLLLIANCVLLAVGTGGGPLIMRLYFLHGGSRVWLSCCLETAGFPLMLAPLAVSYIRRRRNRSTSDAAAAETAEPKMVTMKPPLFFASAGVGILTGLDDYLYAYGLARLPVSTSSLIIAAQLSFTALFAFLLVRQKFTAYSVNAIVLLTVGAGILALGSSGDRPKGESSKRYVMGFVLTVLAAVEYGLILPLVELVYKKTRQAITYPLVMEFNLVMSLFATIFCTAGMIINNDFKAIPREAREFGLGEANYYGVLMASAILWQFFYLGVVGVIFCASSLLSGIIISVLLPVTEVFAVIFYQEKFQPEKGVALALSLWGFVSYFYGEIKQAKKMKKKKNTGPESELAQTHGVPNP